MISLQDSSVPVFTDGSLYDNIDFQKPTVRGLYLELDAKAKHQREQEKRNQLLLSTPDSKTFSLSTPEVETFITTVGAPTSSHSTTITPTPTRFLRPNGSVTAEQEMYAQGFLDRLEALDHLHQSHDSGMKNANSVIHHAHIPHSTAGHSVRDAHFATTALGPNPSLASVAPTYVTATLDYIPTIPVSGVPSTSYPVSSTAPHEHDAFSAGTSYSTVMNAYTSNQQHSMEPVGYSGYGAHTSGHPSFSSMNPDLLRELQSVVPADMKTQEQLKVDRKKARNRIAASKCRLRRLQRESDLQGKVKMLKEHNQELNNEVNGLKEQISSLKRALLHHMKTGCQVNMPEGYRFEVDSTSSE